MDSPNEGMAIRAAPTRQLVLFLVGISGRNDFSLLTNIFRVKGTAVLFDRVFE